MSIISTKQNSLSSPSFPAPQGGYIVRLVPDLSASAFRNKKLNELSLWYCLRSLNYWGSGKMSLELAKEGLKNEFGYTPRILARHLALGNGSFWDITSQKWGSQIKIYALKTVCQYLSTFLDGNKYYRDLPAERFNTLRARRSQLFASIYKPQGIQANPMSRASIEEYTGLNKIQQRRYEQEAKVKRTPTYAMQKAQDGKIVPIKQEIFTKRKGFGQVDKREGNIYHSKQQASSPGMLRRIRQELIGKKSLIPDEAKRPLVRRFFKGVRGLVKQFLGRKGINEGYYLIPNTKRLIKGRLEWCLLCKS